MAGIEDKYVKEYLTEQKKGQSGEIATFIKSLPSKSVDTFTFIKNLITGGERKAFPEVDEIFSNPSIVSGDSLADTKMSLNRLFTTDEASNIDSYITNANAKIAKDINNNILVFFPNGQYGYHNEPGLSETDVTQIVGSLGVWKGAGLINQEIIKRLGVPITSGYRFLDNAVRNMAQAGTFSIGQDTLAEATGSKQGVVGDKLTFNVIAGFVAPGMGTIVEKLPFVGLQNTIKQSRSIINTIAPRFLNKDGSANDAVLTELRNFGVNLEDFNDSEKQIYAKARELGYSKQTSKAYMQSYKYGIDLFDAQINRNQEALFKLNEGVKGVYGPGVAEDLSLLLQEQNEQIFEAVKKLSGLPDDIDLTSEKLTNNQVERVGLAIRQLVQKSKLAAKSKYDGLYDVLDIRGNIQTKGLETFKGNLDLVLSEDGLADPKSPLFNEDFKITSRMYRRLNFFADELKGQKGKNPILSIKKLESERSKLVQDLQEAKGGNDGRIASNLLSEFDKFESDFYDDLLQNTDKYSEDEILQIKKARDTYAEYRKAFYKNPNTKDGGIDRVGKFHQDVLNGNLSADNIVKHVTGLKDIGDTEEAFKKVSGIYDMLKFLPDDERALAQEELSSRLKESFHLNLVGSSMKKNPQIEGLSINPSLYADNVIKFTENEGLLNTLKLFMSDSEIEQTKDLAQFMKNTNPAKFNNASNTAATFANYFNNQGFLPGLQQNIGKLYAYNTGGLKGLFTFRTISSLKGRETGISPSLTKELEQNVEDMPEDLRRALGFVITSNLGTTQIVNARIKSLEDKLNIGTIPTIKTVDDIEKFRRDATGINNMSDQDKKNLEQQLRRQDEFRRIFR